MTDVREAAQNLIEYAIHRSMIGPGRSHLGV